MPPERILAGAMSGTSADGVDVALTRIEGDWPHPAIHLVHHHHRPYDPLLRRAVFGIRANPTTTLAELAELGRQISLTYAAAVNEALCAAHLRPADIAAIAAHGQTLYHAPPDTIQWLDPALLAAETGCRVISDFRRADCAAGGQGAPLVPFADHLLFRHPTKSRVLLNIGGIANLTYLPANCTPDQILAFDTGPGNCISDHLCRKYDPEGPGYDASGLMASRGCDWNGLAHYLVYHHPYFRLPPPKSTDGPAMVEAFEAAPVSVQPYFGRGPDSYEERLCNLLTAACVLTAHSIHHAISNHLPERPDEVIVSGGGIENDCMMRAFAFEFPMPWCTLADLGIVPAAKEALAFALLAAATLDNLPSNIPSATGARHPVVLGSITPAPRT